MITKSTFKLIKSLARKKNRDTHGLFVVEGYKSIRELAQSELIVANIFATDGNHELDSLKPEVISAKEMAAISALKTPPGYLATVRIPKPTALPDSGKVLALDDIQDPGNLGTIIRLADWFGIQHILCSLKTVDAYNPKVVQASMASLGRVQIHYTDLEEFCNQTSLPLYPTEMGGASIYKTQLPENAVMIMGNESRGIRSSILKLGTPISIPQYADHQSTESLNVATATAVILGEWLRTTGT